MITYTAFLTQYGTSAPTVDREINGIYQPVTYEYVNDGIYKVVKPGGWDRLKTIPVCGNVGNGGNVTDPFGSIKMAFEGEDLLIYALDKTGTPINAQLNETPITIIIL